VVQKDKSTPHGSQKARDLSWELSCEFFISDSHKKSLTHARFFNLNMLALRANVRDHRIFLRENALARV
jgi:hypothetical protein